MEVIDTHQHLWNMEHLPYSWCQDFPALNRSFTLKDYAEASEGTGIERTVFVECDVDDPHQLEEARCYQSLAETHPRISGIVAGCRPESEDFPAHLAALRKLSLVKGVRRVLHVVPDAVSQSERFTDNVRRLAEHNLSFDLCVLARQLPLARNLVENCPDVSFVLDHCAFPEIKAGVLEPWKTEIKELAAYPNVVCKVSGLATCAEPGRATPADLRIWVDHILASFGWERVMWGGDWPVCTLATPLATWLATAKSLVSHATFQQQEQFFRRNAERIYRLGAFTAHRNN